MVDCFRICGFRDRRVYVVGAYWASQGEECGSSS